MKLLLILSAFVFTTSTVFADSFTVIRDGTEYLCQSTGSAPIDPAPSGSCANKAYSGPFNKSESIDLCTGARDEAPADCGIKAYSGPFNKSESIQLCKRARSTGPADCANMAYSGPFNKSESLELCSVRGTIAHADCAIKAYSGVYSKQEAIQLCKANPQLALRSLNLIESSEDLKSKVQNIKAQMNLGIEK